MAYKKQLNQILQELLGLLKDTKNFTMREAPDVAKQIIRYEIAKTVFLMISIAAAYLPGSWILNAVQFIADKDGRLFASILAIVLLIGITAGLVALTMELLKLLLAPKVFLLEYVHKLLFPKPREE